MNHLNKITIPAYIAAVLNIMLGIFNTVFYAGDYNYIGINLIVISLAYIYWVFKLNKQIIILEESFLEKDCFYVEQHLRDGQLYNELLLKNNSLKKEINENIKNN